MVILYTSLQDVLETCDPGNTKNTVSEGRTRTLRIIILIQNITLVACEFEILIGCSVVFWKFQMDDFSDEPFFFDILTNYIFYFPKKNERFWKNIIYFWKIKIPWNFNKKTDGLKPRW